MDEIKTSGVNSREVAENLSGMALARFGSYHTACALDGSAPRICSKNCAKCQYSIQHLNAAWLTDLQALRHSFTLGTNLPELVLSISRGSVIETDVLIRKGPALLTRRLRRQLSEDLNLIPRKKLRDAEYSPCSMFYVVAWRRDDCNSYHVRLCCDKLKANKILLLTEWVGRPMCNFAEARDTGIVYGQTCTGMTAQGPVGMEYFIIPYDAEQRRLEVTGVISGGLIRTSA